MSRAHQATAARLTTEELPPAPSGQSGDLLDRIIAFLEGRSPGLGEVVRLFEMDLRREFGGGDCYIRSTKRKRESASRMVAFMEVFDGRNAEDAAAIVGISRATAYRRIKAARAAAIERAG